VTESLAELEEERAFLLRSLADLEAEHEAGDLGDDDYQTLKDGYTARAATVLRAIESGRARAVSRPARRWGRTTAITAGVVALAVGLGFAVARFSGDRPPGGSATGGIEESLNTRLSQARRLLATDPSQAAALYQQVLAEDPDNAEANTYLGWLAATSASQADDATLQQGTWEAAIGLFDRAVAARPEYADPHCFKAIVAFRFLGDAELAQPAVEECLALNPPQDVIGMVQALRDEVAAAVGGGSVSTVAGVTATTSG
jgi:tetratricopeptide (TPR) repeat protein